jgi:hypothetical protein
MGQADGRVKNTEMMIGMAEVEVKSRDMILEDGEGRDERGQQDYRAEQGREGQGIEE